MTQTLTSRDLARGSEELSALFATAGALVLTGAGISTGSGIPDYRGPNGTHRGDKPITLPAFLGCYDTQRTYWARSHIGWERFRAAKPNAAHYALTRLQQAGLIHQVVTQNVDGLHAAAGTTGSVELHGRLDTVICVACRSVTGRDVFAARLRAANPSFHAEVDARTSMLRPDGDIMLDAKDAALFHVVGCETCGGVVKPNVVMFGEHIPGNRFKQALTNLEAASALIVLGSSLAVGSGYRFVLDAKRRGLPIAIVARGHTRGDGHANIKVDADLCVLLPQIATASTG
ncbi:MAG: Sir2 family NAD-dependent protein deacetylase [Nitriliruptoraceae bacterium]